MQALFAALAFEGITLGAKLIGRRSGFPIKVQQLLALFHRAAVDELTGDEIREEVVRITSAEANDDAGDLAAAAGGDAAVWHKRAREAEAMLAAAREDTTSARFDRAKALSAKAEAEDSLATATAELEAAKAAQPADPSPEGAPPALMLLFLLRALWRRLWGVPRSVCPTSAERQQLLRRAVLQPTGLPRWERFEVQHHLARMCRVYEK